jgi:riboflavin synthase
MFTGLVEEKGAIDSIVPVNNNSAVEIAVLTELVCQDAAIGDSIAINGCCLTVIKIDGGKLSFEAGSETLSRTNLGDLTPGSPVNLERALAAGQRMGGHYVSGHIDALGTVDERNDDGEWAEFWFRVPQELTRQMASKGSVAIDGISLTLVGVEAERFSVALIPHTLDVTTLGQRQVGDHVNIETDLLAKYVQRQLETHPTR